MTTIRKLLPLLILGVLPLSACGGQSPQSREAQLEEYARAHGIDADVEVDDSGEVRSVAVNTFGGGQVGSDLALPADFPGDVPVHPSEAVFSASPMPGGHVVQALSDVAAAELAAWHRAEMQQQGWTQQSGDGTAGPQSFTKDNRTARVNFVPNGDGVLVQITTMTTPN